MHGVVDRSAVKVNAKNSQVKLTSKRLYEDLSIWHHKSVP